MNEHVTFNGSPTADGYYTTLSPNEVTVDSSDESSSGGSSDGDFSIAKVTCIGSPIGYVSCLASDVAGEAVVPFPVCSGPDSNEISAVLYKGNCIANFSGVSATSGAIEVMGDYYMITGDCTVSFSIQ